MQKKIRILLITGTEAFPDLSPLNWSGIEKKYEITFHQSESSIAAFLSPSDLEAILTQYSTSEIDFVLVSGLIPWDLSSVHSVFSSKLKKGPKFLVNLPELLRSVPVNNLSSMEPADKIYSLSSETQFSVLLEQNRAKLLQGDTSRGFSLSPDHPEILFSSELPPILLAEIVDFPRLSLDQLRQKIAYFLANGAEMIDFGCITNEDNSAAIAEMFPLLKEEFSVPFSIDSINPQEIHTAVKNGAEMVLSISLDNFHELIDLPKELPIVLIPLSTEDENSPQDPQDRINLLMQLGKIMTEAGFTKIFLDPITDPPISPGILSSLEALSYLQKGIARLPSQNEDGSPMAKPQLFMGFGNLTELIDGDSPGINTLLSLIAAELGVSAILSTEYSNKTRRAIAEINESRRLAFLARELHVPPINLGISALRLKSKHGYPKFQSHGEPQLEIMAEETTAEMDPSGFFRIFIDSQIQKVIVSHYENTIENSTPTRSFFGETAESLYKEIINAQIISRLDHAAYLGKELQRAEIALKYGTEYIQH